MYSSVTLKGDLPQKEPSGSTWQANGLPRVIVLSGHSQYSPFNVCGVLAKFADLRQIEPDVFMSGTDWNAAAIAQQVQQIIPAGTVVCTEDARKRAFGL